MWFSDERIDIREQFALAYNKHLQSAPLTPLENIIVATLRMHPEYHHLLEPNADALNRDFTPELGHENPFLHLGLHIALREQIQADRPRGIRRHYETLVPRFDTPHDAEHALIECLAAALWRAQRDHVLPDEQEYLNCVADLVRKK